jgi:UDP-sulfoquinovose synthase
LGERVRVFNQTTETHRVRDLAQLIHGMTGAELQYLDNPRIEALENELRVENQGLQNLGLAPITLSAGLLEEVSDVAGKYRERCKLGKIPARSRWRARR